MAKRRRPARADRSPEQTLRQARASDGAGLVMAQRLLQGGPEYLHENFIRLMQDSVHLQPEPEFADLYFDLEPTLIIAAKQFRRFKRRLEAAVKAKDHEAFATTYDDYRIAAIAELATPAFKQQLKQGLEQCMKRIRDSRQVELLESATFISVMLDSTELTEDKFPLGIYGLVTAIYEASFERAMLKLPDAPELAGQDLTILWRAYYRTEDLAILEQAVETAPTFAELLDTLENNSKLAAARQRQADYLVKELQEKTIGQGIWFSRKFFTPAEIKLSLDMMETRYLSKPWHLSRYFSLLTIFNFLKCIREVLAEIITAQRRDEIIAWWRAVGQLCFDDQEGQWRKWTPHVAAIIQSLQTEADPARSFIVVVMYVAEGIKFSPNPDNVSPIWLQTFKRIEKSMFWKLLVKSR